MAENTKETNEPKGKHGGARPNSGRKSTHQYHETKPVRVPVAYVVQIKALVKFLDENADTTDKNVESDQIFLRTLKQKRQFISFKINKLPK